MSTLTARLGLKKPASSDLMLIADINANMDILDAVTGVSYVATLASIATPYAGQQAYDISQKKMFAYVNSTWVLVPSGDFTSGNPNRIRLPSGTIVSLSDTTNSFQIGPDGNNNLAIGEDTLQARNNAAAATLKLNENGGDVVIGKTTPVTVNKFGLKVPSMAEQESFDGTDQTIAGSAGTWNNGSPNVNVTGVIAPPSGKVLVTVVGDLEATGTNICQLSYGCDRVAGGTPVSPGGTSRIARVANGRASAIMIDQLTGLNAGDAYNFVVYQTRFDSSNNPIAHSRKLLVQPVF